MKNEKDLLVLLIFYSIGDISFNNIQIIYQIIYRAGAILITE